MKSGGRQVGSRHMAVVAVVAACACAAWGQTSGRFGTGRDRDKFEPVEQNVGDVGPLSANMRLMPRDLRVPMGFDRVYRVPGSSRGVGVFGTSEEKYVRFSGALAAVFPRSEYVETKVGALATIPAGTMFYIGGINGLGDAGPAMRAASPLAVSTMVPMRAMTMAVEAPNESSLAERADLRVREEWQPERRVRLKRDRPMPTPHVFTDAAYRAKRVRELLMAAVGA